MHQRGLNKGSVHRWHRLATILTMMTLRRARHRVAALHRLFRRRHAAAVKRIRHQSEGEHRHKDRPAVSHRHQSRPHYKPSQAGQAQTPPLRCAFQDALEQGRRGR
jgi:hypothetical protein